MTPVELVADIRARHKLDWKDYCRCESNWPCDAALAADVIEQQHKATQVAKRIIAEAEDLDLRVCSEYCVGCNGRHELADLVDQFDAALGDEA